MNVPKVELMEASKLSSAICPERKDLPYGRGIHAFSGNSNDGTQIAIRPFAIDGAALRYEMRRFPQRVFSAQPESICITMVRY